jgi:hypothetical protein
MNDTKTVWVWEVATDPEAVHGLLLASDAAAATPASPPPQRNRATTRRLVADGSVHLLRLNGIPAATFTMAGAPPFDLADTDYATDVTAVYMQRLAVSPGLRAAHPFLGARALRHALRIAEISGAEVLRSETNPDLKAASTLLFGHGFVRVGDIRGSAERPRACVERRLRPRPRGIQLASAISAANSGRRILPVAVRGTAPNRIISAGCAARGTERVSHSRIAASDTE